MGTHKFRFSDIMPTSWLYKLKGISRRRKHRHSPPSPKFIRQQQQQAASSSCHPLHPSPPPNLNPNATLNRRARRRTLYKPSPRLKLSSSVRSTMTSPALASTHVSGFPPDSEAELSFNPKKDSPASVEIVKPQKPSSADSSSGIKLQKPSSAGSSSGIKLRVRMARKRTRVSSASARKSVGSKSKGIAESFAIVLSSVDPERDFRESMVEMIVENNIRDQKDLEDLLACYLSLNASEYHDVIIKAFEKTWFRLTNSSSL